MADQRDHGARQAWWTYIAASIPGWVIAATSAVLLTRWADVPAITATAVVAAWIAADLAKFPRVRRYYTSELPSLRMLGRTGVAVSPLSPHGVVRLGGELWQASAAEPHAPIPEGTRVRVTEVQNLRLVVESLP